jgi:hypothetical protein
MKDNKARQILWAAILSAMLIAALDALTNTIDIQNFSWDFRYYIAMARDGFHAQQLASPFAYRYLPSLLVYGLTHTPGLSIENGFRAIAYVGAFAQLISVFLFTNWFTRSTKSAYVALIVTAFSLFNIKFLFFDVYRPDPLAYPLILLQTYFAFKRKFFPLLFTTLIALQVREFNLIPLITYLFAFAPAKDRRTFLKELVLSVLGLTLAIGLPRLLIPVNENYQFADLSADGLLRVLLAPLVLTRDLIFLYSLAAYALPTLMLVNLRNAKSILGSLNTETKSFLVVYTGLVLLFSFLGGTDFYRFSTYLFLPQAILLGFLSQTSSNLELAVMGIAVFIFNRLWLPFPTSDVGTYLDFYGAYATRFNAAAISRMIECVVFILVGFLVQRLRPLLSLRLKQPS